MRQYRLKHLERLKEANREYYKNNRERLLAYGKEYRRKQNENMTEKDIENRRAYRRAMYLVYKERHLLGADVKETKI